MTTSTNSDAVAALEQQLAGMRAAIVGAGAALSVAYPSQPVKGETVVVPAVVASADFVRTIREATEAIRAAGIDQHLQRVYEVVLPEHQALTAPMGDAAYEVYTRASGFEDLHHELTHLARAARVALALSELDLVHPAWMSPEAVDQDEADQLERARRLVALSDELAVLTGGAEG